jgi:DNA-binding XRE family transcriptional regulator
MNESKRKRLEKKGWISGNASEFLNLTREEVAYVELKLALSKELKEFRRQKRMTQHELARRMKSSQSRIAKMEAGDPSVSIDLLIRSLFALGASRRRLAKMLS